MDNWVEYSLGQLLSYEQPTAYIVMSTDYNDSYKTPVLTAGKSFILGYTNEEHGVYDALPVIIFDDFTTASQYVNFKFKVKSSAMKILTANADLVHPKFIFYRMQIIDFDASTHKRYWIQHYSKIKVKIPPIPEQERIVARIEELFSQLDAGVNELKTAKERLKVYRQAVLKAAFANLENSVEKTIVSVCENIVDCPHSTPKWTTNGKLCLRTTNFKPGYLDLSEKNYVSDKTFDERIIRLKPRPGDILFSREGAILGIACIIPDGLECCMGQRMMLLRPGKGLLGKYLMYYLNSPKARTLIIESIGGTASPHINVSDIKQFLIPMVSYKQQQNTVNTIESRLSVCDTIEQTIDTTLQQAEALRQSILKKAFEGGL